MAVAIASVTETAAASNAFTQTVVRFHGLSTVAVVYSFGPDIDANIDAYEAAYRAAYATYSKFVIVFDARFLGCVPSANTRERKLDLTSSLKWQRCPLWACWSPTSCLQASSQSCCARVAKPHRCCSRTAPTAWHDTSYAQQSSPTVALCATTRLQKQAQQHCLLPATRPCFCAR